MTTWQNTMQSLRHDKEAEKPFQHSPYIFLDDVKML